MNLISYSLFEPKKLYEHRSWDKDRHNPSRYYFNLPSLCLLNRLFYPNFNMHITVCSQTANNKLFSFYHELCKEDDRFSYEVNEEQYTGHQPALWRIAKIWDEDVSCLMSRDIDSVPNKDEVQSTLFFVKSPYSVHTIRSHPNHYGFGCRMLIGLSCFKPKFIPLEILTTSFEDFRIKYASESNWDTDQRSIIRAFTENTFFTSENFLDTKINQQSRYQDFYCYSLPEEERKAVVLNDEQESVLSYLSGLGLSSWAGEPVDSRCALRYLLNKKIELSSLVDKILTSNEDLKSFYLS